MEQGHTTRKTDDKRDRTTPDGAVAVVVVNWNGYEETSDCLESLESVEYPERRVVVVDNGSTDGSGERLAAEFQWPEFVFTDENRGFGGGCNAGIEYALSTGVEYVVLLNPDARLTDGALSELVTVQRESDAAVVGATISQDGSVVNPTPAYYPDMFFYSGYRQNLPIGSESAEAYADERWFETDRVEGAGVLLTSDLLRERRETVGYYLDESLFMYGEEIELAMWCRDHGVRSVVATEAVVEHDSDASSNRAFQLYYLTRNRILLAHRFLPGATRVAFDVLYPLSRAAIATRLRTNGQTGITKSIWDGLVDGYRHVTGQSR